MAPREKLIDYAFGVGWAVTRHAPEPVAERLLEGAADRMWKLRGSGVVQLERNLRRAAPHLDDEGLRELSHAAMRSYFRYWHEAFRLPSWSRNRIVDTVVTTNEEPLRSGFGSGRGAIIALPHMANWDLAGAWACLTGMPVTTVAERLRPESLFDRFVSYREQLGMEVIPLGQESHPVSSLSDALGRGRLVCLVTDRDLTGGGMEVDFLGEPACLPGGPALLARMTGAPLVTMTLSYHGPLMKLSFSDLIAVREGRSGLVEMTQQVADDFSAAIRRSPVDWHMLQRVFVRDLTSRPR